MKNTLFLLSLVLFFACKNNSRETSKSINDSEENLALIKNSYPENVTKVFNAHGGLELWNKMQSLEFTMPKPDGEEVTFTNLKSRESLIKMPKYTIGFDGNHVWLQKKDTITYKGKPKFYYNLMFYFYAMPFVLADDGIVYENTEALTFDGKQYPGIKISYKAGVGESPEDEYILYYDPETYQMAWLGYTVTFFSKEKSKEFHFIKYSDWQTVNGLELPKTLQWYNYESNKPTTKRNDLEFVNVVLSEEKLDVSVFNKPENAKIID